MKAARSEAALVLFSGGQDSTTCLAWALQRYERVETIAFDYGQRHGIELECRTRVLSRICSRFPHWRERLGEDHLIRMSFMNELGETALTSDVEIRMLESGLPNTFVPGRNVFFLAAAAATAYRRGLTTLVGGMCETDYSGYPDCRDATIKAIQVALQLSLDATLVIETPLMWLSKADTWRMAKQLGGDELVSTIVEETHTCYLGDRSGRHAWGAGCGECPACLLRARGFDEFASKVRESAVVEQPAADV